MATRMGVLLGTAPYMSPEQAKGKPVDKRTDIWSFGCVLFEMLTGKRAFDGEDVTDALAAIVRADPEWTRLPASTPPGIRKLLRRCLEKDRKRRLADIADVRLEIDEALTGSTDAVAAVARPSRLRPLHAYILAAAMVAGAVLIAIAMRMSAVEVPRQVRRFSVLLGDDEQFTSQSGRQLLAISPDSANLVYNANQVMYLRPLGSLESAPIAGTNQSSNPFFSPDGEWIAFWQDKKLKKMAVSGGPAMPICEWLIPSSGVWQPDGTIIFSKVSDGLWRVPDTGGQAVQIIKLDSAKGESAEMPQMLPGGRTVLFTLTQSAASTSIQARRDAAQIVAQALDSNERKILVNGGTGGRYLPTGHLVYVRQATLLAQQFDANRLMTVGNPVPMVEGVSEPAAQGGVSGSGFVASAQFTVSQDGVLAYVPSGKASLERILVWVDREGRETPITAPPRAYVYPRLSPDGTRVALDVRDQESDIHIWDLARQTLRRLTFDSNPDVGPVWAPDSQRILFSAASRGLASRAADSTGSTEQLTTQRPGALHLPTNFTPDGKMVLLNIDRGGYDIGLLKLGAKEEPVTLLQTSSNEMNGVLSPDGKWMAYQSNESGLFNIYVRPFPEVQNGKWQLSTEGGTRPAWSRSGEIFYLAAGGTMMSVRVSTAKGFQPDNPVKLFSGPYYMALLGRTYDVTPDGRRFLMIKIPNQNLADAPRIALVENWFEEVKRRVPVK
jgi:serine/threonine-protein kinase